MIGLLGIAAETASIMVIYLDEGYRGWSEEGRLHSAGDLIEIAPAAGGEALLLPFNETTVPTIDLKAGRLIVVPPAVIEAKEED